MKYFWMVIKTAIVFLWSFAMLVVMILIAAMAYGGIKELLK